MPTTAKSAGPTIFHDLTPDRTGCPHCGRPMTADYANRRTVHTLAGVGLLPPHLRRLHLALTVRPGPRVPLLPGTTRGKDGGFRLQVDAGEEGGQGRPGVRAEGDDPLLAVVGRLVLVGAVHPHVTAAVDPGERHPARLRRPHPVARHQLDDHPDVVWQAWQCRRHGLVRHRPDRLALPRLRPAASEPGQGAEGLVGGDRDELLARRLLHRPADAVDLMVDQRPAPPEPDHVPPRPVTAARTRRPAYRRPAPGRAGSPPSCCRVPSWACPRHRRSTSWRGRGTRPAPRRS